MAKYLRHARSPGTQLERNYTEEKFFSTSIELPILPHFSGWVATHGEIIFSPYHANLHNVVLVGQSVCPSVGNLFGCRVVLAVLPLPNRPRLDGV